jgi:hypothetical protein
LSITDIVFLSAMPGWRQSASRAVTCPRFDHFAASLSKPDPFGKPLIVETA